LSGGGAIEMPEYDFSRHTRRVERITIAPRRVIIVDGIFALADAASRALYHYKVFIDAPEELRLARRMERDVRERGRTRESVAAQWKTTVEPMYRQWCYPTHAFADTVLSIQRDGLEQFAATIARIKALISAG
jgi:uridine kinase